MNFLAALTAILGGLAGLILSTYVGASMVLLLPFTAGGFIYTVAADLIPQLHEKTSTRNTLISFGSLLLGVVLMLLVKIGLAHQHGRVGQAVGVSQLWSWSQTHSYDMVRQHVLHE
jgi:zinc and cadmium transporter